MGDQPLEAESSFYTRQYYCVESVKMSQTTDELSPLSRTKAHDFFPLFIY